VRLSDEEREALFEQLSRYAAEGRMLVGELECRIGTVARASTREQAASALEDLLPLTPVAPRSSRPCRGPGVGDGDAAAPDRQPTSEHFRDPRTAWVMRVWVDAWGARHYVADDEA
jgi:hypothetical protein